jgi:hypothetical protein
VELIPSCHSKPESASSWTAAGYSPKSFYFVNLFPSRTKFGPGSGKSHPLQFLSRPRVGLKSDSFCVMNLGPTPLSIPLYKRKISSTENFSQPPVLQANAAQTSFFFLSHTLFLQFLIQFPPKLKIFKKDFFTQMEFYILFFHQNCQPTAIVTYISL